MCHYKKRSYHNKKAPSTAMYLELLLHVLCLLNDSIDVIHEMEPAHILCVYILWACTIFLVLVCDAHPARLP